MIKRKRKSWGNRFLDFLAYLLGLECQECDKGMVNISHGQHEILVKTCYSPVDVWVSFDEDSNIPVCVGDIDKVGVNMLDEGFILYADISSVYRRIKWFVSYR